MRILIIGGTQFVGRGLAQASLDAGHDVTLFHRGQTNPGLFPDATEILADRDGGLDALGDSGWDAVIDTCGYVPRVVKASVNALRGRVGTYVFISTGSVYTDLHVHGIHEESPIHEPIDDPTTEEVNGETYGPLKVSCEREVLTAYPEALIVRAGLIMGPHDHTDRFPYWPARFARGGRIVCPGDPEAPQKQVDGRDLAEWTIRMIEGNRGGVFNVNGPGEDLTMKITVETCRDELAPDAELVWLPDEFLKEHDVPEFVGLPFWLPAGHEAIGVHTMSNAKAVAAGLTFRPFAETVRDTAAWIADHGHPPEPKAGISPETEAKLLRAWEAGRHSQERGATGR